MAKVEAKPYKEGKTWSMRRRVFGQELFESGHRSSCAAKKAMDKRVLALTERGKPKGLGPHRTIVAQALQDMGLERLPFMKGAQQEANRFNRYLRAVGLATLKVRPWEPQDAEHGVPQVNKKGKGQLFVVELEAPVDERRIPRGLAGHRQALSKETAKADAALGAIARMTVADVQPYHVQDFMDALRAASRMPATLQLERAVLRGLFNYARTVWCWSEPSVNPAVGLKLPQVRNNRERVMSEEEERRMDEAIQDCRNAMVGPTLTLLTETAMRSSEPLKYARWMDVDWEGKLLHLRDSKTDSRDVPLSPKAIAALRELARINPGEPEDRIVRMSYEALKAAWGRACDRAGINDLRMHDLRHTAATRMALKTGNVFIVQAMTGHKTLSQLERYVNVKASDVVKVMHTPAEAAPQVPVEVSVHANKHSTVEQRAQEDTSQLVDVVGNLVRANFGQRRTG